MTASAWHLLLAGAASLAAAWIVLVAVLLVVRPKELALAEGFGFFPTRCASCAGWP